ncbi:hypothetical protein [Halobacillus hunanensis]|uniref:hypothetical protein n=1 Tax=Halobacillus hunanensis TaxID=578214 RepID=UPI0009A81060|nr:hypothetical protein [Halobacillus hunanensis]
MTILFFYGTKLDIRVQFTKGRFWRLYIEFKKEIDSFIGALKESIYLFYYKVNINCFRTTRRLYFLVCLKQWQKAFLEKCILPKPQRFEIFILRFCEWNHAERVSLQQLALLLEMDESKIMVRLREEVFKELDALSVSSPLPFSHDYKIEQVRALMPKVQALKNTRIIFISHG